VTAFWVPSLRLRREAGGVPCRAAHSVRSGPRRDPRISTRIGEWRIGVAALRTIADTYTYCSVECRAAL
jgi:hypothetical protein